MVPTAWPRGVSSTVVRLSFSTTLAESKSPIWRALISLSWVTDTRMLSVCGARDTNFRSEEEGEFGRGRSSFRSLERRRYSSAALAAVAVLESPYLEVAMKHRLSMQERQSRRDLLRIPTHLETREALARRCELLHVRAQRA